MADTAEQTDESIVKAVQSGDSDLFTLVVERYEAKLKRYAKKFLSRPEDVDDLVQDVFIKVYEHIQSFDTDLRFSPWIYRIAHNIFVNELQKKSRYGIAAFDPEVILPFMPAKETADQETLQDELRTEIDSLLGELRPKYREVIILFYLESLTYQEISDVLQVSISSVGVRMNRAREQLQTAYQAKHSQS